MAAQRVDILTGERLGVPDHLFRQCQESHFGWRETGRSMVSGNRRNLLRGEELRTEHRSVRQRSRATANADGRGDGRQLVVAWIHSRPERAVLVSPRRRHVRLQAQNLCGAAHATVDFHILVIELLQLSLRLFDRDRSQEGHFLTSITLSLLSLSRDHRPHTHRRVESRAGNGNLPPPALPQRVCPSPCHPGPTSVRWIPAGAAGTASSGSTRRVRGPARRAPWARCRTGPA
jgi:hypothetical protein